MPKHITWNEVVTAAKQNRIARLDSRALEAAILLADEALSAAERRAEGVTGDDATMPPIAAPVPAQRVRRGVRRVDDAE